MRRIKILSALAAVLCFSLGSPSQAQQPTKKKVSATKPKSAKASATKILVIEIKKDSVQKIDWSKIKSAALSDADVNAEGYYGRTALMWVACSGKIELANLLLKKGASINQKDNRGWTALMFASSEGQLESVKILLQNGADTESKDENEEENALSCAASKGYTEIVRLLLNNGAKDKGVGLIWAATKGHLDLVEMLLAKGADANSKGDLNRTALMGAANRGHLGIVKLLLEKGAEINAQDWDGMTALCMAAKGNQIGIAKYLLEKGADVKAGGMGGNALINSRTEEMKQLLRSHGASKNDGSENRPPPTVSISRDLTEVEKATRALIDELKKSGQELDWNKIKSNVLPGGDVNTKDKDGKTILMYAARFGNQDAVILLLKNGAEVNDKDNEGYTALSLAKTEEMKQLLRSYGAKE